MIFELHDRFRKDLACGFYHHGYTAHGQKPLSVFKDVCLIDAFRALGVKVPYTCDGKFWALADGNRMLQPFCRKLDSIERPRFGIHGKYVLHFNDHFFALQMYDEEFTISSRQAYALTHGSKADLELLLTIPDITIWRLGHIIESNALMNYEAFHGFFPGQSTLEDVAASSAGVSGWASAVLGSLSNTHVQTDRIGGAQKSVAGGVDDPTSSSMHIPRSVGRPVALAPPKPPDAWPAVAPSRNEASFHSPIIADPPEPVFPRLERIPYSRSSSSRGLSKMMHCSRCAHTGHIADACPHYRQPRVQHEDAWNHFDNVPLVEPDDGNDYVLVNGSVHHQPGDGHCLFHSLAAGLTPLRGPVNAISLREKVVDFLLLRGSNGLFCKRYTAWVASSFIL